MFSQLVGEIEGASATTRLNYEIGFGRNQNVVGSTIGKVRSEGGYTSSLVNNILLIPLRVFLHPILFM